MVRTLTLINRRILFTIPGRMMSIIGRGEKGRGGGGGGSYLVGGEKLKYQWLVSLFWLCRSCLRGG